MGNGVHQQPGTSSAAGQSGELPDCRTVLHCLQWYNASCCCFIAVPYILDSLICRIEEPMTAIDDPMTVAVINVKCLCFCRM